MSAFSAVVTDVLLVLLLSVLFVGRFDSVSNEVCSRLKNSFQPYVRAVETWIRIVSKKGL